MSDNQQPSDPAALTPGVKQKLIRHLQTKAPQLSCPVCGERRFTVGDHLLSGMIVPQHGGVVIGGPTYPMAFLVCDNCKHVLQFAALPVGMIEPDKAEQGESGDG